MLVKDVRFCFIAANVTIGGRTYTHMQSVSEDVWEDDVESTTGMSGGVIAGIVIAGIVLLSALVVAVVYVLRQRRKKRREPLDSGTPPSPTVPHSVPRESNPLTTDTAETSPHTSPPTPAPPQDDSAVQVPVVEQSSNTVERHMDPTHMQEVVDGNSAPSEETREGGMANTAENVTSSGNNVSHNIVAYPSTLYNMSPAEFNEVLVRSVQGYVENLYATLMNGAQHGAAPQTTRVPPERSANEE
ncbi:hypothetical protein DQ04_22181000 [Trypanosoma grayi]|uniref:hypothetical protein n=1 Tax=Trypanosoma grayi TaxID=71804 RepID=UPI0004F434BA|nr:hypothetical protein DQ04_22181000 [Trypanosoma grayi]KEG05420.1 hypothetical protein DQ04_22181000 [Trypanosoma grayi]